MGAGASLQTLSAQDVALQVAQLGDAYKEYADTFVRNGIDGSILAILTESDLDGLLLDVGILSKAHRKLLGMHLTKLKRPVGTPPMNGAPRLPALDPSIPTRVTQPPSILLGRLLAYQGVHLIDPDDLTTVLDAICSAVGPSQCDGVTTYDCFINYRVASEKGLAEKLYLHMKTRSLHPFLDRMSLKTGEPWKEGFIRGLTQSRVFLALLSHAGLAKCRDESLDHTADNLLLEYEVALAVADSTPSFIILPIYVAAVAGGGFVKFQDFASDLYAPMLHPPMSPRPAIDTAPRRKSTVTSVAKHVDLTSSTASSSTPRRHSAGAEVYFAPDEANRKLSLSESAAAKVPDLLQAARKMDSGSTPALEMLFGMAQRSKHASKITAMGGLSAMVDVLGSPVALVEHKDIAAAVLSFLAHALAHRRQGGDDDVAWKVLQSEQTQAILLSTLATGSNIQTQYVCVGLMHMSNSDAMVKARLRDWKELQKSLQRLAVEGSVVQRDACQELLR